MNLADRIKALRGETSTAEFCRKLNIHRNTLPRYESGERLPDAGFLEAVCKTYDVNPVWLLLGEGPMYKSQGVSSDAVLKPIDNNEPGQGDYDYIPMVETELSAGGGAFVESEGVKGFYAFRKDWIQRVAANAKNLVLMRIIGDSMSPTIQARDTVLIDLHRTTIKEGEIYAIRFESTVMIKRLAIRPGGRVLIISDNRTEYEAYEVDMKELHIIGQIIFFSRSFIPD